MSETWIKHRFLNLVQHPYIYSSSVHRCFFSMGSLGSRIGSMLSLLSGGGKNVLKIPNHIANMVYKDSIVLVVLSISGSIYRSTSIWLSLISGMGVSQTWKSDNFCLGFVPGIIALPTQTWNLQGQFHRRFPFSENSRAKRPTILCIKAPSCFTSKQAPDQFCFGDVWPGDWSCLNVCEDYDAMLVLVIGEPAQPATSCAFIYYIYTRLLVWRWKLFGFSIAYHNTHQREIQMAWPSPK